LVREDRADHESAEQDKNRTAENDPEHQLIPNVTCRIVVWLEHSDDRHEYSDWGDD